TLVEVLPLRVSFVKVAETLKLMDCNSRPPPSGALLPAKVLLVTIRLPPSIRQMPPPAKVEVFRLMVLASTVSEPEEKLKKPPPPFPVAWLPVMTDRLTSSVPALAIPPPLDPFPLVIVMPEIVEVTLALFANT